jgi:hypothetical protein
MLIWKFSQTKSTPEILWNLSKFYFSAVEAERFKPVKGMKSDLTEKEIKDRSIKNINDLNRVQFPEDPNLTILLFSLFWSDDR